MSKGQRAGFTFIEIIVTVAIISLITTLALISYSNVRIKSRDAARVSSINQLMTALQLYKYDTKSYPTAVVAGQPLRAGQTTYIGAIPTNPQPRTDGGCADRDFHYAATNDGYMITMCLAEDTGSLKKGVNICTNGQCQPLADYRAHDEEGNAYGAVQVGEQIWLDANLRSKVKPDGTCINGGGRPPCADASPSDNGLGRSCYDNDEANCSTYGALYTWTAAMDGSEAEKARGLCPAGWHVPSDAEQQTLDEYLTVEGGDCNPARFGGSTIQGRCSTAGATMKVGGGSGLEIPLAGDRGDDGSSFTSIDQAATIWSSTTYSDPAMAYFRNIRLNYDKVWRIANLKTYSSSVRCILD